MIRLALLQLSLAALPALAQENPQAPPAAVEPAPAYAPGWARTGGNAGLFLLAVPVGLIVGANVFTWLDRRHAGNAFLGAAAVSLPLCALLPTFGGRSAVVPDDGPRAPQVLRIVGWVMTIYGAVDLALSAVVGEVWPLIAQAVGFVSPLSPAVGNALFTVSSAVSAVIGGAGLVLLSVSARQSAALSEAALTPQVAVVPLPGGGVAASAGLMGSW